MLADHSTRIRQQILDNMPDYLKLDFYLSTRATIAAVITREYDMTASRTTVGRYLQARKFSPQKPVRRVYERNDALIQHWIARGYPAVARDAKRDGATICSGDEMGTRRDRGTSTGDPPAVQPMGVTPLDASVQFHFSTASDG